MLRCTRRRSGLDKFENEILTFFIPKLGHALYEGHIDRDASGLHAGSAYPQWRPLLRAHRKRPRRGGAADKCDEFPSPHGFARAEDYIGYEQNITFWIDKCARMSAECQTDSSLQQSMPVLGQVLPDFR